MHTDISDINMLICSDIMSDATTNKISNDIGIEEHSALVLNY